MPSMSKSCSNKTAFVIAAVIFALSMAPILLTDHVVKAADTSVGKTLQCDNSKHTKNYCDGFTIEKPIAGMVISTMGLVPLIQMIGRVDIELDGLAQDATYLKK